MYIHEGHFDFFPLNDISSMVNYDTKINLIEDDDQFNDWNVGHSE